MTGLLDLPPELHEEIISHLPNLARCFLSRTSHYFHTITPTGPPSELEILLFDQSLGVKDLPGQRQYYLCSRCLGILRVYHFVLSEYRGGAPQHCLDCMSKRRSEGPFCLYLWILGQGITKCQHCGQMVLCSQTSYGGHFYIPRHPGCDGCADGGGGRGSGCVDQFRNSGSGRWCPPTCLPCDDHCMCCGKVLPWKVVRCGPGMHRNYIIGPLDEPQSVLTPETSVTRLREKLGELIPPPRREDLYQIGLGWESIDQFIAAYRSLHKSSG